MKFNNIQGNINAKSSAQILRLAKEQQSEELGVNNGNGEPTLANGKITRTASFPAASTAAGSLAGVDDESDDYEEEEEEEFGDEAYEELVRTRYSVQLSILILHICTRKSMKVTKRFWIPLCQMEE